MCEWSFAQFGDSCWKVWGWQRKSQTGHRAEVLGTYVDREREIWNQGQIPYES